MSSLFYFVLIFALASAKDYCSVCIDHTMCRFGDTIGRRCGHSSEGGVTDSEIQTILDVHNTYRSKVALGKEDQGSPGPQPTAANMQTLVWDRKLAEVAQRWADQCTFQHDKCRDDPRFSVGQNIYYSSASNVKNWTRAIESWYQEVKHVNASQINNYNYRRESSHYAQLVWATSRYIGCARRSYAGLYRPRGSPSVEYVLGEARRKNDHENRLKETGLYFGEEAGKIELVAGVKGAIKSKDSLSIDKVTGSYLLDNHLRTRQVQSLGYFGEPIASNSNAAKGAVTRSTNSIKPSKPVPANVVVPTKPSYAFNYNPRPHQWNIPSLAYPVYKPFYPTYSQYVSYEAAVKFNHTKESRKNTSDESSEEDSSEENYEEEKGNIVVPASLQFKSWTNDGWQMIDYDLSIDQIYICNYGPTGNFIEEPIYKTGTPCSGCPSGYKCQRGLCV